MKKKMLLAVSACCLAVQGAWADDVTVGAVSYSGAYQVQKPFMLDEVDVQSKGYDPSSALDTYVPLNDVFRSADVLSAPDGQGFLLPDGGAENSLHLLGFSTDSHRFGRVKLHVEGADTYRLFLDGVKQGSDSTALEPGTHRWVVKLLGKPAGRVKIRLSSGGDGLVSVAGGGQGRQIVLSDILEGKRHAGLSLSPDGKYLMTTYTNTMPGGGTSTENTVKELATGRIVARGPESWTWMPRSSRFYKVAKGLRGRTMTLTDPATGAQTVLAEDLPEGRVVVAPTEDYLILSVRHDGPKKHPGVYEILEPADRQPGWRNRSYLAKYDLKTHLLQPLTYGYHSASLNDISDDGRYLMFSVRTSRLTARPTSITTFYKMDVNTLEVETLVENDGFLSHGAFSPDGRQALFMGSPESFGGIGKNVKPDQIPSMYDYQLYLMNLADKEVTPLTRDFDPCVSNFAWSRADGQVYLLAENRDSVSMYRMEPKHRAISRVSVPEELLKDFSLAVTTPLMACCGQGTGNSDRIYTVDLKKNRCALVEDLSQEILQDVRLGACETWNFVSSRGDTIYGRYYLPADFDPGKKYPLIVNYYGGCSPTSRNFETRYPHHVYATMGYVVYVLNPSGATGFGQEFSARHVNTAGKGVAEDIIEGTRRFLAEHPFADAGRVGCIGASYGGFMTQYLQTQTDLFAAAISHAGISDHTSYWGEGYWGYSYSEVSMAGSYPWSRKDLYVDQSPLFNADKIHTPLLFLHGGDDTNVPVGESIQMFTALKLLGRPTAFVVVDGQNHHILDYEKRMRWQNTIFAWFQKYLQGDGSWWEHLYPKASL